MKSEKGYPLTAPLGNIIDVLIVFHVPAKINMMFIKMKLTMYPGRFTHVPGTSRHSIGSKKDDIG